MSLKWIITCVWVRLCFWGNWVVVAIRAASGSPSHLAWCNTFCCFDLDTTHKIILTFNSMQHFVLDDPKQKLLWLESASFEPGQIHIHLNAVCANNSFNKRRAYGSLADPIFVCELKNGFIKHCLSNIFWTAMLSIVVLSSSTSSNWPFSKFNNWSINAALFPETFNPLSCKESSIHGLSFF